MKYNLFILCFFTLQTCTFTQKREQPIPSCIVENNLEKQYQQTICMIKAFNKKHYPKLSGRDVQDNKVIPMDSLELYMDNETPCTGEFITKKDTLLTIVIFYKQPSGRGVEMMSHYIYGVGFDRKTSLPMRYLEGCNSSMSLDAEISKQCECEK